MKFVTQPFGTLMLSCSNYKYCFHDEEIKTVMAELTSAL
jgi:hypothetical protein